MRTPSYLYPERTQRDTIREVRAENGAVTVGAELSCLMVDVLAEVITTVGNGRGCTTKHSIPAHKLLESMKRMRFSTP